MKRIWVVGSSGAGKSTLARCLSERLGLLHTELDSLYWRPGWQTTSMAEFRAAVDKLTRTPGWAICGNYSKVQSVVLERADTVVWLDYPLSFIMRRLLRRTVQRAWSRENLWNSGNYESWRNAFLSRDSLLLYALRTHKNRTEHYTRLMANPDFQHLHWLRFRSARATDAWLAEPGAN